MQLSNLQRQGGCGQREIVSISEGESSHGACKHGLLPHQDARLVRSVIEGIRVVLAACRDTSQKSLFEVCKV